MRILCFGDSNTWGFNLDNGFARLENRWTKILEDLLGNDYEIIEEGLNARTLCSYDEAEPWKMGWTYLEPCLESHDKIDYLIFMLGTNDLKTIFGNSANDIFLMAKKFIEHIMSFRSTIDGSNINLIVLGIPPVNDKKCLFEYYENTSIKRNEYNKLLMEYCYKNDITFIDNSDLVVGKDGIHMIEESHMRLAIKLQSVIKGE